MKAKLIVTQPSNSSLSIQEEIETSPELNTVSSAFVIFLIFSTIAISTSAYIFKRRQHLVVTKPRDKLNCHDCQYFSNNGYLKCALQPTIVLTEESIYCRDYHQIYEVKKFEKITKILLKIRKVLTI
jgi:hypothetical protein